MTDQGRKLAGVAADPSLRGIGGPGGPGYCQVCDHAFASAINHALVMATTPMAALARQYGVSTQSLLNHKRKHLSSEDKQLIAAEVLQKPVAVAHLDVQDALIRLTERVNAALDKAEEIGDPRTIAAVAAEARKLVELSARVLGGLSATESRTVILADNSQWLAVRDHLYQWVTRQSDDVRRSFVEHMRKLKDAGDFPSDLA